jgi:hypothetical protein
MRQPKLSIRHVISIAKTNKQGLAPISCRLTYLKKRKPFATGVFVNPIHWDAKNQRVKQGSHEFESTNTQLTIITNNLRNAYLSLQLEHKYFTVEDILLKFLGKPIKHRQGLVEYFEKYLNRTEKLIGKDLQYGTWKKYNYACIQASSFVRWKYGKKDLPQEQFHSSHFIHFDCGPKAPSAQASHSAFVSKQGLLRSRFQTDHGSEEGQWLHTIISQSSLLQVLKKKLDSKSKIKLFTLLFMIKSLMG